MPVETPVAEMHKTTKPGLVRVTDIPLFCRVLLWRQPVHVADALSGKWRDAWIGPMGSMLAKRGRACGRRCGMNRAIAEVRYLGVGTSQHRCRPLSGHHGCGGRARAPAEGLVLAWVTVSTQGAPAEVRRGVATAHRKEHGMCGEEDRYIQFMAARVQPPPLRPMPAW